MWRTLRLGEEHVPEEPVEAKGREVNPREMSSCDETVSCVIVVWADAMWLVVTHCQA
jgi:hypothetical protein